VGGKLRARLVSESSAGELLVEHPDADQHRSPGPRPSTLTPQLSTASHGLPRSPCSASESSSPPDREKPKRSRNVGQNQFKPSEPAGPETATTPTRSTSPTVPATTGAAPPEHPQQPPPDPPTPAETPSSTPPPTPDPATTRPATTPQTRHDPHHHHNTRSPTNARTLGSGWPVDSGCQCPSETVDLDGQEAAGVAVDDVGDVDGWQCCVLVQGVSGDDEPH
jgi:hypothetical protein